MNFIFTDKFLTLQFIRKKYYEEMHAYPWMEDSWKKHLHFLCWLFNRSLSSGLEETYMYFWIFVREW
jgi:hypothetical protein